MATHIASAHRSRRKPFSTGLHQLPVRRLGFENVPAIPVDIPGTVDTLAKLSVRFRQYEQPLQSLSRTYTLGGTTARAHEFLFGDKRAGAKQGAARERLHDFLRRHPDEIDHELAAEKLDERLDRDARHDLTMLHLDEPKQWAMGWTTLPDAYSLGLPHLDEWAATVDVDQPDAATEAFFPTIARYGRSYNLILPGKVRTPDLAEWHALFGNDWTQALDDAAGAGLLYVIDLRLYETLQPQQIAGSTHFTPSTVTVLVQDAATKALTPELVRVAGGANKPRIFTRQGSTTASAWVYALQAAKVSVTVYGIWLGHVYQWHLVTAAMQMTMFHNLSKDNPVRRLLEPQSSYVIPFDDVLFLQWEAAAPPTSIASGRQFLELIDLYAGGRRFFDDDPTVQIEQLGLTEADFTVDEPWDQYPIVGDLLAIYGATGRYVGSYVDRWYPTDHDVQQDQELQDWIADSTRTDGGNIRGLPAMDSREALKRVLQSVLYRIMAHGTSRLFRSGNPVLTFVANFPPTLHDATIPEPTDSFDTRALHRYLPNTGAIGSMVQFYVIFWSTPPYEPFVPVDGVETDLFFEDEASNDALIDLRRFVIDFVERVQPDQPQIWQWERHIEL